MCSSPRLSFECFQIFGRYPHGSTKPVRAQIPLIDPTADAAHGDLHAIGNLVGRVPTGASNLVFAINGHVFAFTRVSRAIALALKKWIGVGQPCRHLGTRRRDRRGSGIVPLLAPAPITLVL